MHDFDIFAVSILVSFKALFISFVKGKANSTTKQ